MASGAHLRNDERSGGDEGAEEVVAAVAPRLEDGNLRSRHDDRFAQVLQHVRQRRRRIRQGVRTVQDHEPVKRLVPFL